jgi:D-3-phosphoglycerate dehydrogenase
MGTYKILLSAPYMLPFVERFRPVFDHYDCGLIIPEVHERLSEQEILQYAGQFDRTLSGDHRYNPEVHQGAGFRLGHGVYAGIRPPAALDG